MKNLFVMLWLLTFGWTQIASAYVGAPSCHSPVGELGTASDASSIKIDCVGHCPHSVGSSNFSPNQADDGSLELSCCSDLNCHCQSINVFDRQMQTVESITPLATESYVTQISSAYVNPIPISDTPPPIQFF